ncbi:hypothetical protein BDQ94DRAFT_151552 [Aspergillus welwitschiae]|uniref:Uncharacterized protein n=1 Tax=Aspergillus welwitschiae TaxID=1341132 RepID=A0A3F3PR48_9EURO|nr:hypothetical protein BDQ94DRAFT_151552 [Aspergillus welwitschiae]RDH28786.1 hypothetical protein BDQ94DRAFT_151552 [Aspergillus welwitschiae]
MASTMVFDQPGRSSIHHFIAFSRGYLAHPPTGCYFRYCIPTWDSFMDRQAIVQSSKAHPDQVPVGPVHRKGGERMRTGRSDVERSRKSQVTYLD